MGGSSRDYEVSLAVTCKVSEVGILFWSGGFEVQGEEVAAVH
jgi:hypothetical protein